MAITFPFIKTRHMLFGANISIDHIINGIYNSSIGDIIIIGDNTTLLVYEYQFMGSLHVVDSRSQT